MQNELLQLFEEFNTIFAGPRRSALEPTPIHLELELAGVKKDEIKITVEESVLMIRIDSKRKKGSKGVSITKHHDVENIDVKYEDGLLTVDIPIRKIEKVEQKVITIK